MSNGSDTAVIEAQLSAALAQAAAQVSAAEARAQADVQGALGSAQIRANADVQSATITGNDQIQATSATANAEVQAAQIRSTTDVQVAQLQASFQPAVANIEATGQINAAQIRGQGSVSAAQIGASYQIAVAQIKAENQVQVAQINASYETTVATIRSQADVQSASLRADADTYGSNQSKIATEYRADLDLEGTEITSAGQTTRLNIKLAWAETKWQLIFPYVQSGFSQTTGLGASPGRWDAMLSAVGTPPRLMPAVAITPAMAQALLGRASSRIQQTVSNRIQNVQQDLTWQGFSPSSSIVNALTFGYDSYGIVSVASETVQVGLESATANAEQFSASQSAAADYYAKNLGAYTSLEDNVITLNTGMLRAAAQLASVGS